MNIYKCIGNKIKAIRIKFALTQERLAVMMNCDATTIHHYEAAKRKIDIYNLMLFCRIFDINIGDFILYPQN